MSESARGVRAPPPQCRQPQQQAKPRKTAFGAEQEQAELLLLIMFAQIQLDTLEHWQFGMVFVADAGAPAVRFQILHCTARIPFCGQLIGYPKKAAIAGLGGSLHLAPIIL